jgi:lipopolysaccharide transport system permease protein
LASAIVNIPCAENSRLDSVEFVIAPPTRLVSVNWPELWRYRELFIVMAWRDIAVRYKQTVLGFAWAILQPLINMVLFTVIFNRIAHITSGNPNIPYPIFVYVGLLFWQFYSSTLTNASNSMVTNASIIQKVYFPRLIIPATAASTALVDTGIASLILAGMMLYYHVYPAPLGILLIPPMLLIAVLSAMGLGMFLAAVNVKYRDVRHALPFFIQMLMYITPVIYPAGLLVKYPLVRLFVLWLNPISGVITTARATLLQDGAFDPALLAAAGLMSLVFFAGGLYYFRNTERYFADIA